MRGSTAAPAMICQICKKNQARVHLTEISHFPTKSSGSDASSPPAGEGSPVYEERHICEACAHRLQVPFSGLALNKGQAVWNMLKESARRAHAEKSIACPDCGMSLAEFRRSGRLGCPRDYEVFQEQVRPLLLRIHNATTHKGRLPGQDPMESERRQLLSNLREQLQTAIRDEAYESAAQLRDEIEGLESQHDESS